MKLFGLVVLVALVVSGVAAQSFTITSPGNGVNWYSGMTYTITWATSLPSSYFVRIELWDSTGIDAFETTIVSSTQNTGSYTWTVPFLPSADTDLYIWIEWVSSSSYNSGSDVNGPFFSVSAIITSATPPPTPPPTSSPPPTPLPSSSSSAGSRGISADIELAVVSAASAESCPSALKDLVCESWCSCCDIDAAADGFVGDYEPRVCYVNDAWSKYVSTPNGCICYYTEGPLTIVIAVLVVLLVVAGVGYSIYKCRQSCKKADLKSNNGATAMSSVVAASASPPREREISLRSVEIAQQEVTAESNKTTTANDIEAALRRLGDLRAEGVLTEEEYTAKRAKIIDAM